ncbi:MAG TPA: class I SAM-dependent methyltransferase [Thiolinea sp.]|nr:class I SAM-dependent methyltransferase [Thiolinea sp.]
MSRDFFAAKADEYDQSRERVDNVGNIADTITRQVKLDPSMHLMDFGAGTGLLLERIAPRVGKITAIDVSPAMIAQLEQKRPQLTCELAIMQLDLAREHLDQTFDGIISSMTLHHIRDVDAMFARFHQLVRQGGFIAIADLDQEDGKFHSEDTGVFHFGFEREALGACAERAGFRDVAFSTASTMYRHGRDYPLFLLTASR